jgi:hypothetical protein
LRIQRPGTAVQGGGLSCFTSSQLQSHDPSQTIASMHWNSIYTCFLLLLECCSCLPCLNCCCAPPSMTAPPCKPDSAIFAQANDITPARGVPCIRTAHSISPWITYIHIYMHTYVDTYRQHVRVSVYFTKQPPRNQQAMPWIDLPRR